MKMADENFFIWTNLKKKRGQNCQEKGKGKGGEGKKKKISDVSG